MIQLNSLLFKVEVNWIATFENIRGISNNLKHSFIAKYIAKSINSIKVDESLPPW